jgi:hypothetical protein
VAARRPGQWGWQVGADGLDSRAGDAQVDDVVIGSEGDGDPGMRGPSQNCYSVGEVARGRHDPVELRRLPR